ncbi:MAG: sugar-transfer associated ATP-grasp domain-containing protein, partial [bacterium]
GAPITDEQAPQFVESLEVAKRAHRLLPHLRLLGWDVAATTAGPIIFEGNTYWNWEKLQRCNRRGIVYGDFAEELSQVLGSR